MNDILDTISTTVMEYGDFVEDNKTLFIIGAVIILLIVIYYMFFR